MSVEGDDEAVRTTLVALRAGDPVVEALEVAGPGPLVIARVLPPFLRVVHQVRTVEVSPEDRVRVRALRGASALVVGNHPSLAEPVVERQTRRHGAKGAGPRAGG